MVLYKRKEIRFIVSIAVLLFFPLFCNAAATEEPEEEILFITSYNSDTKYTYDNQHIYRNLHPIGRKILDHCRKHECDGFNAGAPMEKNINRYFRQTSES